VQGGVEEEEEQISYVEEEAMVATESSHTSHSKLIEFEETLNDVCIQLATGGDWNECPQAMNRLSDCLGCFGNNVSAVLLLKGCLDVILSQHSSPVQ
jgi:hypothetical protein